MENRMFCNQCEQTFRGTGCVEIGVCGKDSTVSSLQDLLVFQLEGMAYFANLLAQQGGKPSPVVTRFILDGLFSTLTNVNFDPARFIALLRQAQAFKSELQAQAATLPGALPEQLPAAARYALPQDEACIRIEASEIELRPEARTAPDLQSLKDIILYGLKGIAAYAHHAWVLGYEDEQVNQFVVRALSALIAPLELGQLLDLALELGRVNYRCMEVLDAANTGTYGSPQPTPVATTRRSGPFIVISGHDLKDLYQLLQQTAGKGINVYTHGELLPAHAYPLLHQFPHLAGNYGGAWQNQQREFELPGAVLMTTNCLMEPRPPYADRLYTTGVVGWPGIPHIEEQDGVKDFTPVIEKALALGGWQADEPEQTILTGFGHAATLSHAAEIVAAVKSGQIRHFFLVGGCDGARPGRNYYAQFAAQAPQDTVILTLACGKYRFNKQDFGTVAGLPRLLDIGQCNDAYSAIRIASALADAFDCGVNDLPLTLVLSWYEQKAVCILLTLLALGIQNIHLGPTLPAFITPNVLNVLVEQFKIRPISTPEADLAAILQPVA